MDSLPSTFTMSITPFTAGGEIDEPLLREHVRWLAGAGVGIYLCSQGSGEGDLMSIEERIRVYEIGVDAVAGATPVYAAGVGLAHSTDRVIELAQGACRAGVDAVYVLAPRPGALAPRPAEIERYFDEVISAIDRPVVLSNNASLAGYSFSVDLIERLVARHGNIREVLVAEQAGVLIPQVSQLVAALGERITVRVGMSNLAPVAHALGARGMLNFEANMVPRLTESIWAALHGGDHARAQSRFQVFLSFNLLCARFGNPRVIKEALRLLGRDGGHLRRPYLPMEPAERDQLAAGLAALDVGRFEQFS